MNIDEFIIRNTIRIEVLLKNGNKASGTGFFYNFQIYNDNIPVIVTNKHVVKNTVEGYLFFSLCDEAGTILDSKKDQVKITDFEKKWIMHPSENIDLCIMPIAEILKNKNEKKKFLDCHCLQKDNIINNDEIAGISHLEDVIIVGYPDGIWDSYNNLPILRKGITATPIQFNFLNEPKFLIDAAIYGGSSGSPVFIFRKVLCKTENKLRMDDRLKLSGIVYAVAQHTVTGELKFIDIPTQKTLSTVTNIPNNLGVVIKANKIFDFERILKKEYVHSKGVDPNE